MERFVALWLALLLDMTWGDPPSRYHPVAWMGQWLAAIRRHAPAGGAAIRFVYGAVAVISSTMLLATLGRLISRSLWQLPAPWRWLVEAGMLKMLFSLRGLLQAGDAVREPLATGDLDRARQQLGWHLVSRDTGELSASQVAAATVESLAENTCDSAIAPFVSYAVLGLPGALVYRFLNTADAMLGYRDPEREWLGKTAARLDDAANLLPARLTAALLVLAALFAGGHGGAWRVWRRDAHLTASPNAGHPMSAMAGALGVELEKVGHYKLGRGLRPPCPDDIARAIRLVRCSVWIGTAGLSALPLLLIRRKRTKEQTR